MMLSVVDLENQQSTAACSNRGPMQQQQQQQQRMQADPPLHGHGTSIVLSSASGKLAPVNV